MRCVNFDILKYVDDYNTKVALLSLPIDHGTERLVKKEFVQGLPFHIKEYILRYPTYPHLSLTELQLETKRQMQISNTLNKNKPKQETDGKQDYGKQENKQYPVKQKVNMGELASLWGARCNMVRTVQSNVGNDTGLTVVGKVGSMR